MLGGSGVVTHHGSAGGGGRPRRPGRPATRDSPQLAVPEAAELGPLVQSLESRLKILVIEDGFIPQGEEFRTLLNNCAPGVRIALASGTHDSRVGEGPRCLPRRGRGATRHLGAGPASARTFVRSGAPAGRLPHGTHLQGWSRIGGLHRSGGAGPYPGRPAHPAGDTGRRAARRTGFTDVAGGGRTPGTGGADAHERS